MASCPLVLRELPRGPVPYVAPSLCVLQNFPLPCVVFCKELLSRGKHRVPFFFSGLVAMLGVLSSLSQVLPRSTTLARACPEQVPSRMHGPWRWGGLNGPFEALRPQRFVPVSRLKSCSDCVEAQAGLCGQESFPPLWGMEPHGREFLRGHRGQVPSLRGLLNSSPDRQTPIRLCCLSCPCSP